MKIMELCEHTTKDTYTKVGHLKSLSYLNAGAISQ